MCFNSVRIKVISNLSYFYKYLILYVLSCSKELFTCYRCEQCVTTAYFFFMTIANTATQAAVRQRCVFP